MNQISVAWLWPAVLNLEGKMGEIAMTVPAHTPTVAKGEKPMVDRFHETLVRAAERVARWPEWKRKILGLSAEEMRQYYARLEALAEWERRNT